MIDQKKMSQMMKQAKRMQKKMNAVQETLEDLVVEGVAADGMVKVKWMAIKNYLILISIPLLNTKN